MKTMVASILLAIVAALGFLALRQSSREPAVPFYLAQPDALRELPFEDVLRMRDDILRAAANQPDRVIREAAPEGSERVAEGLLVAGDREARGKIVLHRESSGVLTARLEDYRVANAPGLELYFSSDRAVKEGRFDPGSAIRAGTLRGNAGSENFQLPSNADLSDLETATIWCDLFRMVFARAELPR